MAKRRKRRNLVEVDPAVPTKKS